MIDLLAMIVYRHDFSAIVIRRLLKLLVYGLKMTEHLILKPEQQQAVDYLLSQKDVLAVLPTGFGLAKVLYFKNLPVVRFEKEMAAWLC